MRIIKYYEHSANPGEVVPLRLSALEEIIADRVCNLLNSTYSGYGNNVVEIEFRRADVQYVYCNRRREANFALCLHRKDSIIDDIFVTINYNTNELISIESTVGSAFNRELFKTLSFKLTENEKEKKGMKIKMSLDEFETICKKVCCDFFKDNPKEDQYCFTTYDRYIDTDKMVLKVALSFIPNNVQKLKHNVRFIFNGISGDVAYAAVPSLPVGIGSTLCAIICREIRKHCMGYTDTDDVLLHFINGVAIQFKQKPYDQSSAYKVMLSSLYENQFEIEKVTINNPAMIVFWKDGTKTVVTAKDEAFDPEKGLAMAFAKKALGNNYAAGGKFKARLKHAQVIKGKEADISKIPICKEIMDEAMRRVKAEMEADSAKNPAEKPAEKKMTKTAWVKMMMSEMGYTRKQASEAWDQNHK